MKTISRLRTSEHHLPRAGRGPVARPLLDAASLFTGQRKPRAGCPLHPSSLVLHWLGGDNSCRRRRPSTAVLCSSLPRLLAPHQSCCRAVQWFARHPPPSPPSPTPPVAATIPSPPPSVPSRARPLRLLCCPCIRSPPPLYRGSWLTFARRVIWTLPVCSAPPPRPSTSLLQHPPQPWTPSPNNSPSLALTGRRSAAARGTCKPPSRRRSRTRS